jgi:dynein light chain roadblock-type
VVNNDGIVIKYENMDYKKALHYSHQLLQLYSKASKYTRDLFDAPDNEVESIRLKTVDYEMVIAQHGNFTVILTQKPEEEEVAVEVKEGEEGAEKKEEAK